ESGSSRRVGDRCDAASGVQGRSPAQGRRGATPVHNVSPSTVRGRGGQGMRAPMDVDVAIINGTVVDPDLGETYQADVGVKDGKVAAIARQRGQLTGKETIDARGMLVTPGLVDSHVHVYQHVSSGSLDPDSIGIRQGVVAVVD